MCIFKSNYVHSIMHYMEDIEIYQLHFLVHIMLQKTVSDHPQT